jgi:hypothetical protein
VKYLGKKSKRKAPPALATQVRQPLPNQHTTLGNPKSISIVPHFISACNSFYAKTWEFLRRFEKIVLLYAGCLIVYGGPLFLRLLLGIGQTTSERAKTAPGRYLQEV